MRAVRHRGGLILDYKVSTQLSLLLIGEGGINNIHNGEMSFAASPLDGWTEL